MKRAIMATMERLRVQRGSFNFEFMKTMMMMYVFRRKGQVISLNWFLAI